MVVKERKLPNSAEMVLNVKTNFIYQKKMIENIINHNYLGLIFNTSGTWSNAIENLSARDLKAFLFAQETLQRR